jgi:hypothetical protein
VQAGVGQDGAQLASYLEAAEGVVLAPAHDRWLTDAPQMGLADCVLGAGAERGECALEQAEPGLAVGWQALGGQDQVFEGGAEQCC